MLAVHALALACITPPRFLGVLHTPECSYFTPCVESLVEAGAISRLSQMLRNGVSWLASVSRPRNVHAEESVRPPSSTALPLSDHAIRYERAHGFAAPNANTVANVQLC